MRGYAFPILSLITLTAVAILLALFVGDALGGDVIVYSARCERGEAPVIYAFDLQRELNLPVTRANHIAVQPAASPDGKRIAYLAATGSEYALYVMNADGRNRRGLIDHHLYKTNPTWSPDGKRIAFISDGRETAMMEPVFQLYVADLDMGVTQRLTQSHLHMYSPEWLPDGESIIVSALTDRNGGRNNLDLYLVDPYSGTMQAITDAARVDHVAPDISPDGARVAYIARYTNAYQSEIMVLDLEDGDSRILWTNLDKGILNSIEWSPDGGRIAFIRADYITSTQTLYTVSADGGEAQRVDLPCAVVGFSWRPDARSETWR